VEFNTSSILFYFSLKLVLTFKAERWQSTDNDR